MFDIPLECRSYRNLALAIDYKADDGALIRFNKHGWSEWYAQYHLLARGTGDTVFAVPIKRSTAVDLTLARVDVHDARLICF